MSYPPLPNNGETNWGTKFRTWADAIEHSALAGQPMDAGELIASRLSFRQGDITVGIASDSTSDGPTDWVRLWEAHLAEKYPHLRIENNQWNSTSGAYGPTTVVQEGEGEPAYQTLKVWSGTIGGGQLQYQIDNWDEMFGDELITPGTEEITEIRTLTDSFARTGMLAGSVTDTGQSWTGSTNWTSDGTRAFSESGSAYVKLDHIVRASATVEVITTTPTSDKTFRLGMRTRASGVYGLYLSLSVTMGGYHFATAYVRTPTGGYRPFPTLGSVELTLDQSTPQNLPLEIRLDGLTVTATAGNKTGTWQITQAEANELDDHLELQSASVGVGDHVRVLSVQADYVHTTPATNPVYGDPLDVMIIGHGHNYGQRLGPEFITILDGFLDHMRDRRPSTLPLLSSQNPQFPPTANPGPHADRQLALRRYARENGYTYAPVFEHFASQPDGGKSWVHADGVHPTEPTTPTPTPGTGMSEWGKVLADTVTD